MLTQDPGEARPRGGRWWARLSAIWSSLPRTAMARTGALTLSTGIARLGTVVAAVVVARSLGRADLGRYAAALAIGSIVVSGPTSGLPIMAIRDVAAGRRGRAFVMRAIRVELLVTVLATGVAVLVSLLVVHPASVAVSVALLTGIGNIASTQLTMAQSLGLGLQRSRLVVALQIPSGILLPALTAAALAAGLGLPGAVAAVAASTLPCALAGYALLWPAISHAPDALDTRHLLWRSRSFLGFAAVNGGYQRLDAVMLPAVSTAGVSGLYAAAYRFIGPFDLLAAGLAQVLFPLLSKLTPGSTESRIIGHRARRLYVITTLPLVAVALTVTPTVMAGVFGGGFRSATPAARILLLSVIPTVLYWPDALALMAAGFETAVLYLFVASTVVDAVLVATLSGPLGAAGAAWAWVVAQLSLWIGLSVVRPKLFPRHHPATPPS